MRENYYNCFLQVWRPNGDGIFRLVYYTQVPPTSLRISMRVILKYPFYVKTSDLFGVQSTMPNPLCISTSLHYNQGLTSAYVLTEAVYFNEPYNFSVSSKPKRFYFMIASVLRNLIELGLFDFFFTYMYI